MSEQVLGIIVGAGLILTAGVIGWFFGRQGRADVEEELRHSRSHVEALCNRLCDMYGCRKQPVAPPETKNKSDEPRRPIVLKRRMPPKE